MKSNLDKIFYSKVLSTTTSDSKGIKDCGLFAIAFATFLATCLHFDLLTYFE